MTVGQRMAIMEAGGIAVKRRGELSIFFSYADGTGSCEAMLAAAAAQQRLGRSVIVGDMDGRENIGKAGLTCLPLRRVEGRQGHAVEFDLDAALRRRPQILLLRNLAHRNLGSCRHERRDQDVARCSRNPKSLLHFL